MGNIMAISFKIGEIEFTVSTAAEAKSVVREFGSNENKPSKSSNLNGSGERSEVAFKEGVDPEIVLRSKRFLTAIRNAPSGGAESKAIMEALRVEHPKGVGAKSVAINKLLTNLGYNQHAVYRSVKRPKHPRRWRAGPSINTVISELQDALNKALSEREALR